MKILYIASSFPSPDKGSTIYTDLAEALLEAGHKITVAVFDQPFNNAHTGLNKERNFEVLRVLIGDYFNSGFIRKGITTLKLPGLMKRNINKFFKNNNFDFILFEAPPITNSSLVKWAKKKYKCPAYLMLKDIFPQNAADLGILSPKGLLFKFFRRKEKQLFQTADIIGCMSKANIEYVISHNSWLDTKKVEIFPNTKKLTENVIPDDLQMREKYGIPKNTCVFLFGGNMGRPQFIELLCKSIIECKNDRQIFFLFVGRGTDRPLLEKTIKEHKIPNALVIKDLPRNEYEQITKESDVGLIILDPRFSIPNYPSRILSYMEYSKPVLAATDKITDIKDLIETSGCGDWVWSGNSDDFISKIREMALDADKSLTVKGKNGRKYIEENFRVEYSVKILEKHFKNNSVL